ncbi:carboxypeptidase-like regulatory domain-containing protein [Niabella yanshanensis]|uniref:Carboxypeptidase-like regulatory domain-containing protein n=1 Tax=Niabella yanshanensis TaxID=577386 RepID=A0ABZ0W9Q5_9BACT|nr:carboxypeptidase-like regulatory domain-containing protein [Niabella yanshanensis]WQD38725.1 carboxypeptidase-like regulatory domain-containing protein [Niabella yanshanensis]
MLVFLLACRSIVAQHPPHYPAISGAFKQMKLAQFFFEIEKQSGYKFFFDQKNLDTTLVNIEVQSMSLDVLLNKVFSDTDLRFAIDSDKNVFITKGFLVQTHLPVSFYDERSEVSSTLIKTDKIPGAVANSKLTNDKVHIIGVGAPGQNPGMFTLTGYVRHEQNGAPVSGASLFVENSSINAIADYQGFFSIILPSGNNVLSIQSIGMEDVRLNLNMMGDGRLIVPMQTKIMSLKNVVVSAQKMNNLRVAQLGVQKLDIKTIKQVPTVFGEADILRVLLTTPGVKTVGEASTGLNVRGGSTDQNLILFNEANIYNPSHFFGMFSAFNPEVVKDVELFKGSIPARHGGRLASVVNINSRSGNKKKFEGAAGIGLLTSRLEIEGPVVKDKSSFIIAGRTTYADWLLKQLPEEYKNSKASFYDLNLVFDHEFNEKNSVHITGYLSKDRFNLNSDTFYHYKNQNISIKWKHTFNSRLHSFLTIGRDGYDYSIESDLNPVNGYQLNFDIGQTYLRNHYNYMLNSKHNLEFGLNSNYHKLHSGNYRPIGSQSLVKPVTIPAEQALETALYISENYKITPKLSLDAGLRYSIYAYLGPYSVNNYPEGVPKQVDNILGTTKYGDNKVINTYQGPEFRIGLRQLITPSFSFKAGYNNLRQYIHMLSNTTAMAPTDIWKLSDPNINPQSGDQFSLGLYKNLKSNTIEISLEGYYKRIKDYLDFKSGAVLVLNPHIETDVLKTRGKAYGLELLLKKSTGKLNGWVSYTYSRILLKADDPDAGEIINNGAFYPANYDKPHDVTFIGNYQISHRFSISLNTNYSTGRPITLPIGRFYYDGGVRTLYADRNAYRIPDYFRTDFSMNIEGNHKVHQKTHNSWTIGVYNLTGRKNPFSVYYVSQGGAINGYKLSIFGSAIPFVNFNIRF